MKEHKKQLEEKIKTLETNLKFVRWKNGITEKLPRQERKVDTFSPETTPVAPEIKQTFYDCSDI
ncbi:transcriptional regulator [Lactococcus petauri]|uniref:transcriptional regulator n=1 Tax=Lactococcus petauri TaxID=1940789 RepID=UPI00254C43CA|nr:transcriptional regulator [Lactococcus petauri]